MRCHRFYSFRRHPLYSAFRILVLFFLVWDSLHCLSLSNYQTSATTGPPPPRNTKRIYIASQHWNDARLLREHWNNALVALVQELGVENVFVSIYESGSYDYTKGVLEELDAALEPLQVKRSIQLSDRSHADEIAQQPTDHGWIKASDGETYLRRMPFLATIRNHVFEPLERLAAEGEQFDTILFLNDVVFTPEDVLRLLDTNGGHYAAACSIDFKKPPQFYDTFALRDSSGHEALMQTWPYFRSYASRHAAEKLLPVPVSSCWNGIVAMPIEPFLASPPLRFRGIPDSLAKSHVEASECCLIHADNPLSASKGVFLNPNVRVGYNGTSHDDVHSPEVILSPFQIFRSLWRSRILRWTTTSLFKEQVVRMKLGKWTAETKKSEPGGFCLVNEMQVIIETGWKHM
ncbi:hypothetical protein J4E83_000738 [Alternaria metachromatica]|uniref:uncharacterized protein n=1 Tax=Alternaria metachromatica TaxID=283354 RepID=UPI0020C3D11B|nr:uncharacterized protein J4E83_000738 [Alternaria metachromatica]KAI4637920.1 hypothetical protein J4E83_000738 [Alternaria metachromatica]